MPRRVTAFAGRGGAVLGICEIQGAAGRDPLFRFLCRVAVRSPTEQVPATAASGQEARCKSSLVLIGKKRESRDGFSVTFAQFKGRKKGAKVLTLPILPPLRAIPEGSELGNEAWIESMRGAPYAVAAFGNVFKDWCVEAGLSRCSCHGRRKIGAVRAAEAGASEHELMAMSGWEDANMGESIRVRLRRRKTMHYGLDGAQKRTRTSTPCSAST
jgi:hypothetical protein